MKKNSLILKPRTKLSLGDLVLAVSSCTKDTKDTVAAVADLLGSGKVRLQSDGKILRAKVCWVRAGLAVTANFQNAPVVNLPERFSFPVQNTFAFGAAIYLAA